MKHSKFIRWTITAISAGLLVYFGTTLMIEHQVQQSKARLNDLESMLRLEYQRRHPPELTNPKVRSALRVLGPIYENTGSNQVATKRSTVGVRSIVPE